MIALSVAKAGYYGGDPEQVLNGRVDMVLHSYYFEDFCNKLQYADFELNKDR